MSGYIPINKRGRRKQRIAYLDAEPLLFEGLRSLLATDYVDIVRSLAPGMSKLDQAKSLHPDILMLEFEDFNEIAWILDTMAKDGIEIATVILRVPPESVDQLRMISPRHCLLGRSISAEQFLNAIRIVVNGGSFVDPAISSHPALASVAQQDTGLEKALPAAKPDDLSEREKSVLVQIALGHYSKEIAANLNLSIKTIETYKTRAMKKLELPDRVSIVRHAISNGWFDNVDDGVSEDQLQG